jgi:hypothetical protein
MDFCERGGAREFFRGHARPGSDHTQDLGWVSWKCKNPRAAPHKLEGGGAPAMVPPQPAEAPQPGSPSITQGIEPEPLQPGESLALAAQPAACSHSALPAKLVPHSTTPTCSLVTSTEVRSSLSVEVTHACVPQQLLSVAAAAMQAMQSSVPVRAPLLPPQAPHLRRHATDPKPPEFPASNHARACQELKSSSHNTSHTVEVQLTQQLTHCTCRPASRKQRPHRLWGRTGRIHASMQSDRRG